MKRIVYVLFSVLLIIVLLCGCKEELKYDKTYYQLFSYEVDDVFLFDDETYTPDIATQFAESNVNISEYELFSYDESVATIEDNKVVGKSTGKAYIGVIIYDYVKRFRYIVDIAFVHVFISENLKEIRTAEDLANIANDLDGHYILKANINLAEYGLWVPIDLKDDTYEEIFPGVFSRRSFTGILINPDGYEIKNLTVSHQTAEFNDGKSCCAGLFALIGNAYIDGIILKNVNIDIKDFTGGIRHAIAGGIAGDSVGAIIRNCHVTGTIYSQFDCGGIIGINSDGYILNCSFEGTIKTINDSEDAMYEDAGAGGIAGFSSTDENKGGISNCNVKGTIDGHFAAGGIVGANDRFENVYNCTFEGTLEGRHKGEIIGVIKRPFANR